MLFKRIKYMKLAKKVEKALMGLRIEKTSTYADYTRFFDELNRFSQLFKTDEELQAAINCLSIRQKINLIGHLNALIENYVALALDVNTTVMTLLKNDDLSIELRDKIADVGKIRLTLADNVIGIFRQIIELCREKKSNKHD